MITLTVNSAKTLNEAITELNEAWAKGKYLTVTITPKKRRTLTQNAALHLYFTQLADALNSAGLDQRKTLKPSVPMPWSPHSVKEFLWRPIQLAALQKESTKSLTTQEVNQVFEVLARHLAQRLGVSVAWPEVEK